MKKQLTQEEKDKMFYIKNVEKLLRTCLEYSKWATDKRNSISNCEKCNRVNDHVVEFEVHHEPLNLYENVEANFTSLTVPTLELALDVLKQHIEEKISVKVICSCCHTYHHAQLKIK